jgi:hypothetical protein
MSTPDRDRTLEHLRDALDTFIAELERLPIADFLARADGWSPRDIAAHLVGWHKLTIAGADEIRRGRIPSYFADAANDYASVNADLVREHDSTDRDTLVGDLRASLAELDGYIRSLPADAWAADTGVRYRGEPTTIANSVAVLIEDLDAHRRELNA